MTLSCSHQWSVYLGPLLAFESTGEWDWRLKVEMADITGAEWAWEGHCKPSLSPPQCIIFNDFIW